MTLIESLKKTASLSCYGVSVNVNEQKTTCEVEESSAELLKDLTKGLGGNESDLKMV